MILPLVFMFSKETKKYVDNIHFLEVANSKIFLKKHVLNFQTEYPILRKLHRVETSRMINFPLIFTLITELKCGNVSFDLARFLLFLDVSLLWNVIE